MTETLKRCPFCGVPVNRIRPGELFGWHREGCFFRLLDEREEADMTQEELDRAFVTAWNRRAPETG